jgi:NAD(P)-dependent dehydrogenase (short-subunit alcohol dehydrogenase family)
MADHVIVTGANDGIGLGLARALLARGCQVAGLDLRTDNLPPEAAWACDVRDADEVDAVIARLLERWPRIDILVNNACVMVYSPFEQRTVEGMRREFDVNYFGYVHAIKAVLPHMKARGRGIIHNVASPVGVTGMDSMAGYASAKAAVEALSRTLDLELRPHGIAVNVVQPPLTRTRSGAPIGVPARLMADAETVGAKLAGKIGARGVLVTAGPLMHLGMLLARLAPQTSGRLLSRMAQRLRRSG